MTMGPARSRMPVAVLMMMIAGLSLSANAATYTVGGSTGWNLGISATFYDDWAKGITFAPGDTLDFNYVGSTHNVFQVSQADLTSCSTANPITTYQTNGGASVPIKSAGNFYYICGVPGHCTGNMKLSIVVPAASAPATPPTVAPATPPPVATPPPAATPPAPATTPPAPAPATTPPAPAPAITPALTPVPAPAPAAKSPTPAPTSEAPAPPQPVTPSPSGEAPTPSDNSPGGGSLSHSGGRAMTVGAVLCIVASLVLN